jgi:hypothetical protein
MTTPTQGTTSSVQNLTVANLSKSLTHRVQRMHIFMAPKTAPIPDAITYAADASAAPELINLDPEDGWQDMGLIGSDDAPTWERDIETVDLQAIGFRDAIRSDVTTDVANLTASFLEWKRPVLEAYENIDMSGITPDPVTGEIRWVRAQDAPLIERRYAAYGQDGVGADRVWIVRFLTAGVLDTADSQVWGGEEYSTFPVTLKGNVDTELGTSLITAMGGPGLRAHLADMGFEVAGP